MKRLRAESGSLLAASPDLRDPNFMHAVVLICQHSDQGAYGLIVNRPSKITVDVLMPKHPLLGHSDFPVHIGGPVGRDTMQFVHSLPDEIPGGVPLAGGLWLGGGLDKLAEVIDQVAEAPRKVRLLVGYSGWGEGQLDGELADGSWVPAPMLPELPFSSDPEGAWREAVRALGGDDLAGQPPDVSWN